MSNDHPTPENAPGNEPAHRTRTSPSGPAGHDHTTGDQPAPDRQPARDDRMACGERTRRVVLGDAHVDRAQQRTTSFTADFQEFITGCAWADIWSRPGIDRTTRRLLTVAILTALRCEDELTMHLRAALDDGVPAAELKEVLLHTSIYAGLPAANRAFTLAAELVQGPGSNG